MTVTTSPALEAVSSYFAAWNQRDPAAIAACFAEGSTYSDPTAGTDLAAPAIAAYAAGLFQAFPDLAFDLVSVDTGGRDRVIAEWLMRGTNSGSLNGGPPTGRSVAIPGVDLIDLADGGIKSVRGFFDRRIIAEQLGLQVVVQPQRVGPVVFGTCVHLESPIRGRPGAFGVTAIDVRSDEEAEEVVAASRRIMPDLAKMQGFMGFLGIRAGHRLFTITAWSDPDEARQLRPNLAHAEAVRATHRGEISTGGHFGTVVPHTFMTGVRCPACQAWARVANPGDRCGCGQEITELPPVW